MMVTRSMMLAESVEIDISARSGMKSAVRLSPGPSLGCAKTPQKPSEPSNGHAVADVLVRCSGRTGDAGAVGESIGNDEIRMSLLVRPGSPRILPDPLPRERAGRVR